MFYWKYFGLIYLDKNLFFFKSYKAIIALFLNIAKIRLVLHFHGTNYNRKEASCNNCRLILLRNSYYIECILSHCYNYVWYNINMYVFGKRISSLTSNVLSTKKSFIGKLLPEHFPNTTPWSSLLGHRCKKNCTTHLEIQRFPETRIQFYISLTNITQTSNICEEQLATIFQFTLNLPNDEANQN